MNPLKNKSLAIGLMSGTSMDGVDCALIESDGHRAKAIRKTVHMAYSDNIRHDIMAAMTHAASLGHPAHQDERLDHLADGLTDIHGAAVAQLLKENNLDPGDITVIGFHGQTLLHRPQEGWTWQIGNGQRLARQTRIQVVSDFRRQDVDNGGQGAPLVPVYHQALLKTGQDQNYPVAIINIGGVGNITWVGSGGSGHMLAFDTGPGNALLDDWVRRHTGDPMDRDGALAAEGMIDHSLVTKWLTHPYFSQNPPKSLDRQQFTAQGVERLSLESGAATLLEFTAKSIEMALNHCPQRPTHIYVCGGGRHNKSLMARLGKIAIPLDRVEKLGWNGDFLEAEAFAFLACRHLLNLPITFPGTTGISKPTSGGRLFKP